jgi:hypothetical protein
VSVAWIIVHSGTPIILLPFQMRDRHTRKGLA